MRYWRDTTPSWSSCPRVEFVGEATSKAMPATFSVTASDQHHGWWTVHCRGLSEGLLIRADNVEDAKIKAADALRTHLESLYLAVAEAIRQSILKEDEE